MHVFLTFTKNDVFIVLSNKYFLIQFTSDDTVRFHNHGEGLYWLNATSVTRAFKFKTLLRHYAKQVDMKLGCQGKGHRIGELT